MTRQRHKLHILFLFVAMAGCAKPTHHWEHLTGKQAVPYSEAYIWVNDETGRTDDCNLTLNSSGNWSLYIHGAGYGDYNNLENAKQACYKDFDKFF